MDLETTNKLIELRKLHGYSQEDLAAKLGVSRQAISKWERGEASPDTDNLIALAKLYDISLDELLSVKPSGKKQQENEDTYYGAEGEKYSQGSNSSDNNTGFTFGNNEGSSVHIGKGGVHVRDGKDEVHIDWDGIHIHEKDKPKDPINVTFNSDDENGDCSFEVNGHKYYHEHDHHHDHEHKDDRSTYEIVVDSISGVLCVAAYLVLGCVYGMWHPGWIIFLLFPILPAIICPKKWEGSFPIIVAGVYLCLGFFLNAWHPGWIIFLSIPIFYTIWNAIKTVIKRKRNR